MTQQSEIEKRLNNYPFTCFMLHADFHSNYTDVNYFCYMKGIKKNKIKHILDVGQMLFNNEIRLN